MSNKEALVGIKENIFFKDLSALENERKKTKSTLRVINIRLSGRRTSVRLEPDMLEALQEIAKMNACSIHEICDVANRLKKPGMSFTSALRVYIMKNYRQSLQVESKETVDIFKDKLEKKISTCSHLVTTSSSDLSGEDIEWMMKQRMLLDEISEFFQESKMDLVAKHLREATNEIDRIWLETV